jgi:hypothetical protein
MDGKISHLQLDPDRLTEFRVCNSQQVLPEVGVVQQRHNADQQNGGENNQTACDPRDDPFPIAAT